MEKSRFFHPYYVLNGLLVVTYITLRMTRLYSHELSRQDMFGVTREAQIYFCLALMLFSRTLSAPTVDAYLSSAFAFTRVAVLTCLYYMSWQLFVTFLALWTLIYAVCPQPRYQLPSCVATLTTPSFNERIARNTHKTIYVLWCHAPWSPRCSQLTPVLAKLASRYDHPRVRFARIDVSRFSDAAEKLGVSIAPTSKQLPCVISFKQGREVARVPKANAAGQIPKEWVHGFTVTQLEQALDLKTLHETATKWEREAQLRYEKKRE